MRSHRQIAKRLGRLLRKNLPNTNTVRVERSEIILGVFPSDLLLQFTERPKYGTVIINANPHTEGGSHWLSVHSRSKSSIAYCIDSSGLLLLVPNLQTYIRRNSTTGRRCRHWRGMSAGKYCCLLVIYVDGFYTPIQFPLDFRRRRWFGGSADRSDIRRRVRQRIAGTVGQCSSIFQKKLRN
jgi:hypothetical protein